MIDRRPHRHLQATTTRVRRAIRVPSKSSQQTNRGPVFGSALCLSKQQSFVTLELSPSGESAMKFGVITFPGSNCDHDAQWAFSELFGQPATLLWHNSHELENCDVIIVP